MQSYVDSTRVSLARWCCGGVAGSRRGAVVGELKRASRRVPAVMARDKKEQLPQRRAAATVEGKARRCTKRWVLRAEKLGVRVLLWKNLLTGQLIAITEALVA